MRLHYARVGRAEEMRTEERDEHFFADACDTCQSDGIDSPCLFRNRAQDFSQKGLRACRRIPLVQCARGRFLVRQDLYQRVFFTAAHDLFLMRPAYQGAATVCLPATPELGQLAWRRREAKDLLERSKGHGL